MLLSFRKAVAHRSTTNSTSSFRRSLLDAILDVLRKTPCALSSGAVHWVFKLLTGFAAQANATLTSFVCLELLEFLSTKLSTARFPEHLVLRSRYTQVKAVTIINFRFNEPQFCLSIRIFLKVLIRYCWEGREACVISMPGFSLISTALKFRTPYKMEFKDNVGKCLNTCYITFLFLRCRYGLYGCPLDPVLFNAVPQTSTSQQNSPVASNLVMPTLTQKGVPPASTVSFTSEQESWSSASSSLACQGLLEVQPLHFVCCSTSDGARIERADVSQVTNSLGPTGASTIPLVSSGAPMPMPAPLPTVSASLAALEQELQMLKVRTIGIEVVAFSGNLLMCRMQ